MRVATTTRTMAAATLLFALSASACEVVRPSEARSPTLWGHVFLDGEAQRDWPVIIDRRCVYTTLNGGWELFDNVGGKFREGDTVGIVGAVPARDATVAPNSYLDVVAPAGELDFRYTTVPGKSAVRPASCDPVP